MRQIFTRCRRKLNNSSGETLVEVLASILICSLSVAFLVSMIMTSVQIDRSARAGDTDYYRDLASAEAQTDPLKDAAGAAQTGTATVTDSVDTENFTVNFFGGSGVYSYHEEQTEPVAPGGEEPGGGGGGG